MKKNGLTKKEIFSKSSIILKNLLKNYGSFEISTIDKLTQKIVRNFSYELGIDAKYEIDHKSNNVMISDPQRSVCIEFYLGSCGMF